MRTVEVAVADALGVKPIPDPGKEARELAEDERAVAAGDDVVKLLDEGVELGARDRVLVGVDETGMEAQLAQAGDRAQDRDPVAIEVVEELQHALALALEVRVVELAVAVVKLDEQRLLLLGGQLGGDELLRAPLDERPDPAAQPGEQLRVDAALDRPGVMLGEALRVGEQARRGER